MMTLFGRFRRLKLDPAVLGLARGEATSTYFCTPVGAQLIGWAGADGIHYCFIRAFGEMVFAVDPMNVPGNYVYPLARTFEDFLRLLLACCSADALQQAHAWEQAQFDRYLRENPATDAQTAALDKLAAACGLTPMEDPLAYLKAVYTEFDRAQIKFRPDYYEWAPAEPQEPQKPAWKVYYHGNFWGHRGRDRAGLPIPIHRTFPWGEDCVCVPAVYSCAAGLVADLCIRVDPARIRTFLRHVDPNTEDQLNPEERERLESLNPLHIDFRLEAAVNGRSLRQKYGCSLAWLPEDCLPEGYQNERQARWILEEYGLDPAFGWLIHRVSLPWATSRRPALRTLTLTLHPHPISLPGQHFTVAGAGDTVTLTHPLTGAAYTLTVQEYEAQTLDPRHFRDENMEYPTHCVAMSCSLSPDLPRGAVQIRDCAAGDRPRCTARSPLAPEAVNDAVVAVIGSADGPTALAFGPVVQATLHAAVSSLRFEPAAQIEWRVSWQETTRQPLVMVCV